jgi:hypothetical protein
MSSTSQDHQVLVLNQVTREDLVLMGSKEGQEDKVRRELQVSTVLTGHMEYQDDLEV